MVLAKETEGQPRDGLVGTRVQGRVVLFEARSRASPQLTLAKRKEQGPWEAMGSRSTAHPRPVWTGAETLERPCPRSPACSPGGRRVNRSGAVGVAQASRGAQAASLEAPVVTGQQVLRRSTQPLPPLVPLGRNFLLLSLRSQTPL